YYAPGGVRNGSASDGFKASDAAKIVRTATLQVRLRPKTLAGAAAAVKAIADGAGGYVSSSSETEAAANPSAEITIRVPVRTFDAVLTELRKLAGIDKVLGLTEHGDDVTAQYTDLQAQVTAETSERNQLLVVLSRAQTIGDILAVRDRINAVQT